MNTLRHGYANLNLTRNYIDIFFNYGILGLNRNDLWQHTSILQHRGCCCRANNSPQHLICFNNWTEEMVNKIIYSARNLKSMYGNTHGKKLNVLKDIKVMIFEDHNEPILRMAVSKATSFLGATDVHITDVIDWDNDYIGRVYSNMADVIFVSTQVFECVRRFAHHSDVPVVSMRCRKYSTLQALATIMSIMEDYCSLETLNMAYVGAPHPILNDYLLLCPMFKINLKFKCCCKECGVSPLLLDDSKHMCEVKHNVSVTEAAEKSDLLTNATAIIAGPTPRNKEKISEFQLTTELIKKHTKPNWTFYHTLPRGKEIDDELFWHYNSRTFNAFKNIQYIAAAIMAYVVHGYTF